MFTLTVNKHKTTQNSTIEWQIPPPPQPHSHTQIFKTFNFIKTPRASEIQSVDTLKSAKPMYI